ncbi:MAG: carboxymuconolactone decarboxylase family protein [Hyphomicrobiaceae bacterium]
MTDRLPPIPADKMTEAQKKSVADIVSGPRGRVVGPFNVMLRSPEFMDRAQKLGEYLRFRCVLGEKLKELVILVTARNWSQQFEFTAHGPIAIKAGLDPKIVEAIADGRRPDRMDDDETLVHDFCTEMFRRGMSVSDSTYERALARFGEQGVVEMVGVSGYYTMLAMLMNVARTALPEGAKPPLTPYPG